MVETESLLTALPRRGITIISGYRNGQIDSYVALYDLEPGNFLTVTFPKEHHFTPGQAVTLHLDNRTGVGEYDAELRVYRVCYKGRVGSVTGNQILITPEEFQLVYSDRCINKFVDPSYKYEEFDSSASLPESDIRLSDLSWNNREFENKLGVLITTLPSRPHSSLMAFLSGRCDDVFLISMKNTFKAQALRYNNSCCFAMDHRADFVFEKAYDWNYTIVRAKAFKISPDNPAYEEIQYEFVNKNPWETSFFTSPEIEMYHLKPEEILLSDNQ